MVATFVAMLVLCVGAGAAEAAPTWSIDDQTVLEGNSGSSQVTFTISASGLTVFDSQSIHYATANGTAGAPGDYGATSGTATVTSVLGEPGSATVTVPVNGDTVPERDETFTVVLSSPSSGTIADATGVGALTNDDAPHLTVSDPSVAENAGAAVFTVSLDGAAAVTVHYATADGTAQAGSDYSSRSGTLTFTRTDATKTVSVPILDDAAHEGSESFGLALTGASGIAASGNDLSATATIADDDPEAGPPPPPPPPPSPPADTAPASTPGTGEPPATSGSSVGDVTTPEPALSNPRTKRGTILVSITCPATETLCRGTLTTFSQADPRSKVRQLRVERKLGSTTFVIAGGKTASITTRLSAGTRALLRRAGRVGVRSYAVVRDNAGNIGTANTAATFSRVR
jgi:hypothetical protein